MSSSKVAVVLGGTIGAGPDIALGLAKNFAGHVYITGWTAEECDRTVDNIEVRGVKVKHHQLNPNDPASVEHFKKYLTEFYDGIDVFVNNESIKTKNPSLEEMTRLQQAKYFLMNNYFQVAQTCNWMFPMLRSYARVVHVSNAGGYLGLIPSGDLRQTLTSPNIGQKQLEDLLDGYLNDLKNGVDTSSTWGSDPEVVSKVALTTLTMIQQRIFDRDLVRPGILVNAVHPGYLEGEDTHDLGQALFTPDVASKPPIRLALQKNSDFAQKGQYVWFDNRSVNMKNIC